MNWVYLSIFLIKKQADMKKVLIEEKKLILDDFFKVEEANLRFEQFNGEMSPLIRRFSFERGNSVAILAFNLDTQKIILINQFRYPTCGNGHGWITELIAGMVDKGELPKESAQRELMEEAGLNVSAFEHISTFYSSPGGCSEQIFLYYAEVSGEYAKYNKTGGLIKEGEDILSFEISLEDALDKIKTGEIKDAKTIIGIYWLENRQLKKPEINNHL
jgi:nudix-type nucleoside diphosphatase (YffH/AdpP family)